MKYIYLPSDDYNLIKSKLVSFFQEQYPSFSHLKLTIVDSILYVATKNQKQVNEATILCQKLLEAARICCGIQRIVILLGKKDVFYLESDIQSTESNVQFLNSMAINTLEKPILENQATITTDSINADTLLSLGEITRIAAIEPGAIQDYIQDSGTKINVFAHAGEILIPAKQVLPLIQGYFNWYSNHGLQEVIKRLTAANILASNPTTPQQTANGASKTAKPATETAQAQAKTAYKLASDFKPKTSYAKTLEALLEGQRNRASELLAGLKAEEETAMRFLARVAKKYKNPDAAQKALLTTAKDYQMPQVSTEAE